MSAGGVLSTIQKLASALERLDQLAEDVTELRVAATSRIERLEGQVAELRERLVRLETAREADLAKLQAEAARFRAEVERAEMRLVKPIEARKKSQK